MIWVFCEYQGSGNFAHNFNHWGNYWSWDSKEVWALITFMVYAVPAHRRSLPVFNKPVVYHAYMIFAFLTILMTYFGVNYYLTGMHSYA